MTDYIRCRKAVSFFALMATTMTVTDSVDGRMHSAFVLGPGAKRDQDVINVSSDSRVPRTINADAQLAATP